MKIWSRIVAVGLLCAAAEAASAASIPVPDTTVSAFHFSGMVLNSAEPSLSCIVTGPADMTATITIWVMLFERPDSPYPYAKVGGNTQISTL